MKNRRMSVIALAFLLIATFTFLSACKKNPPTTAEQVKPPVERPVETQVAPPVAPAPPAVQPSILSEDLENLNRKGYLQDAFFDFDKADLRSDARTALATDAEWLKKYSSIQVLIEGHCDERGTAKYNLSLGDRRANAAKEYLASLGVDVSRIKTLSYGKERPFCTASTEECWQ
ncbi:MAG TPA: OmpA family protein, partial [Thermoanaerobaculia bacterium]|nr:OmpA family protein [Thermoanaerobaculia bacterium]